MRWPLLTSPAAIGYLTHDPDKASLKLPAAYPRHTTPLAGPRSDRERLENLHPHFNIRMGRELGGAPDAHLAQRVVRQAVMGMSRGVGGVCAWGGWCTRCMHGPHLSSPLKALCLSPSELVQTFTGACVPREVVVRFEAEARCFAREDVLD